MGRASVYKWFQGGKVEAKAIRKLIEGNVEERDVIKRTEGG